MVGISVSDGDEELERKATSEGQLVSTHTHSAGNASSATTTTVVDVSVAVSTSSLIARFRATQSVYSVVDVCAGNSLSESQVQPGFSLEVNNSQVGLERIVVELFYEILNESLLVIEFQNGN